MSDVDALIVGAGPVGLTLATECRRSGVSFRIIDKNAAHSERSKALAIWSGTLECMSSMGLVDEFLARSMPGHGLMFHDTGKFINRVSLHEGVESAYPIPVILPQCETEEILIAHLQRAGVTIERSVEMTGLKNEASGVEAELTHSDRTKEIVRAKYLAGCDGAHSFARHHLPVTFDGVAEESSFILIDCKVEGDLPSDHLYINWGPIGISIFFPIKKDVFRLFAVRQDKSDRSTPTVEEFNEYLRANGLRQLRLYDAEWLGYFGVHERYASRARVGRVFLLGDAAHVHSPAGGQGMNTGMQDAFNLGWKLALLTRGKGDAEAIAESFHAERHPVAKALIEKTTKLLHFGMAHGPFIRLVKDAGVKYLFQANFMQEKLSGELSELHINYPESPLVSADSSWSNRHGFKPGSKPRDVTLRHAETKEPVLLWRQFLLPKHTLVLFSGKSPKSETLVRLAEIAAKAPSDSVQTVIIWQGDEAPANAPQGLYLDPDAEAHKRYGLDQEGWYLVRPDQYLAARSATLDPTKLETYLAKALR